MAPAHHVVELDQVGCPDPAPRYQRFFHPPDGQGSADLDRAGADYIGAAYAAVQRWVSRVPSDAPLAVAFSGGVDSTAVLLLARQVFLDLGRDPARVRACSLDLGGGADAAQAETVVRELGIEDGWERIAVPEASYDLVEAIRTIEDYHPLDVECAAASLCLLRGIRERYPALRYLLDGDGGDENLKSYPLDDSDLTLSSVLRNPLLYHEGWGVDAIKHSEVYSGGLSRAYVRTSAPAAACGFESFSPFTVRSVIEAAVRIPFAAIVGEDVERLYGVKQDVVRAGIRAVLGVDMPVSPKRRFQDGARAAARPRVSKAWCRQVFNHMWEERLRDTPTFAEATAGKPDALDRRRSGNEMAV
jgi:asparagine synthase (glutamine-hydrolysing)